MTQKLGRLEKVQLREVWETEAGEFTPWLASKENIALLGEAINLDLEVEAQEKRVGPFRADILCKDTADDSWVLIENQFDRTDHGHLGQLLTYASGLKAVTIVWVAEHFTEEHRATLDWLNEITGEEFNFFGLEVELWRIGGSEVAPKFNVVSQPNDWSRTVATAERSVSQSETKQLQFEYWTAFRRLLEERGGRIRPTKPGYQHWQDFSLGRSGFHLSAVVNTQKECIGVFLVLSGDSSKAHFSALSMQKSEIEKEIGGPLDWSEQPGRKQCYVRLLRSDCDPGDRSHWSEQHEWLYGKLQLFHQVFAERVRNLDVEEVAGGPPT